MIAPIGLESGGGSGDGRIAPIDHAQLSVACGPLCRPLSSRFVAALAATAELPIDRVEAATRVAVTLAEHCTTISPDGEVGLTVRVRPGMLDIRVGPLERGGAHALLELDEHDPGGPVIPDLATHVAIRTLRDDREVLSVLIAAR